MLGLKHNLNFLVDYDPLRDALRRDPRLRAEYIEEKEKAAAAAPVGRAEYNDLKGAFLARLIAKL